MAEPNQAWKTIGPLYKGGGIVWAQAKIFVRIVASLLVVVAVYGVRLESGANGITQKPNHQEAWVGIGITKSTNPEKMRAKLMDKDFVVRFALLNVLPFSKWPTELSKEQQKLKTDAEKRFEKLQEENSEIPKGWYYVAGKPVGSDAFGADLYLTRSISHWVPGSPSSVGWGITHVNIWMIQEGLTVYQPKPAELKIFFANQLVTRDQSFLAAEKYAITNKKGIWKDKELASKLRKIANPELKK